MSVTVMVLAAPCQLLLLSILGAELHWKLLISGVLSVTAKKKKKIFYTSFFQKNVTITSGSIH